MRRQNNNEARERMQITLSPKASNTLRGISKKTYIPMSYLLDMMITEYAERHNFKIQEERTGEDDG